MTTWTNWAGNQSCHPAEVAAPRRPDEVVAAVERAHARGIPVKALGAGHSFTGVAATDGLQLSLDGLSGITHVDREQRRVRVLAGTPLHVLNPALHALGLALPNLGDIDRQSVAGAISTGTHGTGIRLQGIAAAVSGLELVLADGSVLACSAEVEPEVFQAARVGLGALGVITEVELQCVPAFRLHAKEFGADLFEVLERLEEDVERHDHVDMHWFPLTDRVLVKHNDRVPDGETGTPLPRWRAALDDDLLSNRLFELTNRGASRWPAVVPRLNAVSARLLGAREYTDDSWRVFVAERKVRFRESEYAVPRAAVTEVVLAVRSWLERHRAPLTFPLEIRFIGADDIWLSTAYQRENAYLAIHQYHRMDDHGAFAAFEAIVAEHEARPHWGKLHTLGADRLRELYPRFDDFVAVRDRLDPQRRFANAYLDHVLGR
ncbi:FAD-linked oxidoreductase [Phycicoccus badiiscoriae]|uniref:FAD-linked oxidoreductase n=1 Tax=Pedococcus badiiscoriae TaxID=642776 RepID=A0A852WAY7_9MICO|nr:D-arabinono-1,4-lactone oxidase [Pedococcus badiiscoriae]NYG06427.1 FAD-linked oxidoreductase [Pedococcus badiiscoriae]